MRRNLDMTALRSFVTVADSGGVTRAAGVLNLTQSAVSMQLKRLEEGLGLDLFDRRGRQMLLTGTGEQLLSYARRMLALNDEAVTRLTDPGYEGEVQLGVPHDIVYPVIPTVLNRFAQQYPRVQVTLHSSNTLELKQRFAKGEVPVILTTEEDRDAGGETLAELPLLWVGAPGGRAWTERPIRLAFEEVCIFRTGAQAALDRVGIDWTMAVQTESSRTVEASVSADLAGHAVLDGTGPPRLEVIEHGGSLPDLGVRKVNLYAMRSDRPGPVEAWADMIREEDRQLSGRDHHLAGGSAAA